MMREFMDYVRSAFYDATGWNRESSYSSLNSTADGTAIDTTMRSSSTDRLQRSSTLTLRGASD